MLEEPEAAEQVGEEMKLGEWNNRPSYFPLLEIPQISSQAALEVGI